MSALRQYVLQQNLYFSNSIRGINWSYSNGVSASFLKNQEEFLLKNSQGTYATILFEHYVKP